MARYLAIEGLDASSTVSMARYLAIEGLDASSTV